MIGKFFVNSVDAYVGLGLFVLDNEYENILSFPNFKKLEANDWFEEDGLEVDLSNPVLEPTTFTLKFGFQGDLIKFIELKEFLLQNTYHVFNFEELGRTFVLRITGNSDLKFVQELGFITLDLADDFPTQRMNYLDSSYFPSLSSNTLSQFGTVINSVLQNWNGQNNPNTPFSSLNIPSDGFKLDGKDFIEYGISILQGSLDPFNQLHAQKENISIDSTYLNGQIYDDSLSNFKDASVKINCLLRADTLAEFWKNFDSFMYNLIKPNERVLYIDSLKSTYNCYYNGCNVTAIYLENRKWLMFEIGLKINSFIESNNIEFYGLTTEDDIFFGSEELSFLQIEQTF